MKSWFKGIVELSLGLALWRFYTSRFYITEKPSIEERRERFLPCVVRRTAILLWEERTLAKDKHRRTHVEGLEADSRHAAQTLLQSLTPRSCLPPSGFHSSEVYGNRVVILSNAEMKFFSRASAWSTNFEICETVSCYILKTIYWHLGLPNCITMCRLKFNI